MKSLHGNLPYETPTFFVVSAVSEFPLRQDNLEAQGDRKVEHIIALP